MSETPTKKVMYRVERPDVSPGLSCIYKTFGEVEAEFDGAEVGETIQVEIVEMTDEEFEELGDFEGW